MTLLSNLLERINQTVVYINEYKLIHAASVEQNKIIFDELFAELIVEGNLNKYRQVRYQFDLLNTDKFYTDRNRLKIILKHLLQEVFCKCTLSAGKSEIVIQATTEGVRSYLSIIIRGNDKKPNGEPFLNKAQEPLIRKAIKAIKGKITFTSTKSETAINLWLPDLYATQGQRQFSKPNFTMLSKSNI